MSGFWMEGKGIVLFLIVVSEVILVLSSDWRIKSERHRKQIGSFFGQFIDIGVYLVLPPIDHLGNAQLTFADLDKDGNITVNHTNPLETEIIQENHYYPFGMQHEQPTTQIDIANDYTYNGKELNDDFDLNLHDYGARWYDASLGRFHTTDRFQEKYVDLTPYQYGGNNPILFIDINGDSLDVGGPSLQESFKDVQESMLDKKDQERLTYDKETGSVSLNLDGVKYNKKNKIKNRKLRLLNEILDSDLKILYENTTEMHHRQSTAKIVGQNAKGEYLFKLEKTIPWTTSTEIYPDFGFIMNSRVYGTKGSWAENNVTGTRAYVNSVVQLPKEGYDVHLGVHSGLIASRSRIQIIGHSIREKYYMQNFNMERDAAHDKSGQGNLTFWRIISK